MMTAEKRRANNLALAMGDTSKGGGPVQAGAPGSDAGNADRHAAVNRNFSEERADGAGFGNGSIGKSAEIVLRVREVGYEIGTAEGNHESLVRGAGQDLLQKCSRGIGEADAGHELTLGHDALSAGRTNVNRGNYG